MPRVSSHSETKIAAAPADLAVAAVAARQHGVVTLEQLEASGLGVGAIKRRVAAGRLQRLWRGVYTFGHSELRPEGRLLGAVLACGQGAVLSQRSAADHWGVLRTSRTAIDVTVATLNGRAKRRGIHLHCVRRLDPRDVTALHGIPITTPARTLVDLCATVPPRMIERALEQSYVLQLIAPGAIEDALQRAAGRKTGSLRRLIARETRTPTLTRSELEEAFLALCRRGGLPDPEVNVQLHGYEVDFLWRAFERDRRKDVDLELAGFPVTRFTHDQVIHQPEDTLRRARQLVLGQ